MNWWRFRLMIINTNNLKGKHILYIVCCLLFLLYLLFSDAIFARLAGSSLRKDHIENYNNGTAQGHAYIDSFTVGTDLFQRSSINGWAMCETDQNNDNRFTKFIFVSEENVYSVEADLWERGDVRNVYADSLPENTSIDLGAQAMYSPILMANGIYELNVYCWENEQDYGLIKTGLKFRKDGRVFEEYIFQSEETDPLSAGEELKHCAVDIVSASNSVLEITGWAYLENQDCNSQEVFVQLTNDSGSKLYTTESKSRPDVSEAFDNVLYENCGYTAKIPVEQLEPGTYSLEVFLRHGERIASASKGTLRIKADNVVTYKK